jgi:CHASE3 domain sensor protein
VKVLSLKNKIDLAFLVIIAVVCVLLYATYFPAQAVTKNRAIIRETYTSNIVLEKLLSSTIDLETGGRGFIITGQERFLEPYVSGEANIKIWLDSLKSLKKDKPQEMRIIAGLEKLIAQKKVFTAETIRIRREEGMEKAKARVGTGQGKEIMDSIRDNVAKYQKQQLELLNKTLFETNTNIKSRNISYFLFVVATLFILVFGYTRIRRNAKKIIRDGVIQENLSNELTFQNQQLNNFANQASHNLRSSAANMSSLIDIIEEKSTIDDFKMVFELLRKVSTNLTTSLNELIEILRIKKSHTIEKESVDFSEMYDRVSDTLQGDIIKNKATVLPDFSKAPNVMFSKIYLESIMQNLVSNAIKYHSPQREPVIKITSSIQNGHDVLTVEDNGLGIDLQRHGQKIFGMYQMFHKHPEAKGIGLFITKAQVENLDGKISVASDGHSGTTFTIRFAK